MSITKCKLYRVDNRYFKNFSKTVSYPIAQYFDLFILGTSNDWNDKVMATLYFYYFHKQIKKQYVGQKGYKIYRLL